jgi:hypothetical protein
MRKPIQLTSTSQISKGTGEIVTTLFALSDDGKMFVLKKGEKEWEWMEVPPLPQPAGPEL